MNEDVINCSCHIINKRFWNACIPTASTTKQTNIRMNVVHFQFEIVENGTHTRPFQLHSLHSSHANWKIHRHTIETVENFQKKKWMKLFLLFYFSLHSFCFYRKDKKEKKKKNSITITIITPTPFNYLSTFSLLCNYIIAFLFSVFDIFQRCCVVVVFFLSIFFAFF